MDAAVDSREGIELLAKWAKAHHFVLNEYHEQIARKHGVSMDGVIISRPMPVWKRNGIR